MVVAKQSELSHVVGSPCEKIDKLTDPRGKSLTACASSGLPGVTKRVPRFWLNLFFGSLLNTDRIVFKSAPEATTHALQVEPGWTADKAAAILDAMPPRPCALFSPMATSEESGRYSSSLNAPGSVGGRSKTPSTSVSKSKTSAPKVRAQRAAKESLSEKTSSSVYPKLAETASFSLIMGTIPRLQR